MPNTAVRLAGYCGTQGEFWSSVQIRWELWRDLHAHPDTYRTVAKRWSGRTSSTTATCPPAWL